MRNTIGMAAARVLSDMYRERDVRKEPSPPAPSRGGSAPSGHPFLDTCRSALGRRPFRSCSSCLVPLCGLTTAASAPVTSGSPGRAPPRLPLSAPNAPATASLQRGRRAVLPDCRRHAPAREHGGHVDADALVVRANLLAGRGDRFLAIPQRDRDDVEGGRAGGLLEDHVPQKSRERL